MIWSRTADIRGVVTEAPGREPSSEEINAVGIAAGNYRRSKQENDHSEDATWRTENFHLLGKETIY